MKFTLYSFADRLSGYTFPDSLSKPNDWSKTDRINAKIHSVTIIKGEKAENLLIGLLIGRLDNFRTREKGI